MHELNGTVKEIFDEVTFPSGFNKREFVVTDENENYPQDIKFECVKEKVNLLNPLKKGDPVKVFFNLRGNEYNGKYYVNLAAWKIESGKTADTATESVPDFDPADEILDEEPPF